MNKKDIIEEIESHIGELEGKLSETEQQIKNLEDELGDTSNVEATEEIKRSIENQENKRSQIERLIFDLKIKKTELSYLKGDNTEKNYLAKISLGTSLFVSLVLIVLTSVQTCTSNDLVAVGILESAHSHGEIKDAVGKIELICEPLVESEKKNEFRTELNKVKKMVEHVENKISILQRAYQKEIKSLKKD